jgi:hypothetical protein
MQAAGDITLPDIPHDSNVSRNNGKKEFAANFPRVAVVQIFCAPQCRKAVVFHEVFAG